VAGAGPIYSPKLLEIGGNSVEGIHTTAQFFPEDPRPNVQKFVKAFVAKYNQQPNVFAGVAFDSANILFEAISRAGTDRQAIRDELLKTKDYPGVTGMFTFTEHGTVVKEYLSLIIQNGEFKLYE
jgi:branched-chain amino acid transport system substrate-binding protein